jgi:hypothetical protein
MTTDRPTSYRIYLLTFWLEDAGDRTDPETWRFRLEEPKSGRRRGCVGITALLTGLISEIRTHEGSRDIPQSLIDDQALPV